MHTLKCKTIQEPRILLTEHACVRLLLIKSRGLGDNVNNNYRSKPAYGGSTRPQTQIWILVLSGVRRDGRERASPGGSPWPDRGLGGACLVMAGPSHPGRAIAVTTYLWFARLFTAPLKVLLIPLRSVTSDAASINQITVAFL